MFDLETFHLYFDFPARGDQKDGDGDEGEEREGKEAMEDLKMIPSKKLYEIQIQGRTQR